ncbi:MAG: hypothetical protein P1P89_12655 [Desulfobacterales bacterium]|nr:hypothetical protein [Desulfobacterales bacterium]
MVLTMAAVADNKKISLDVVDVRISYEIRAGRSWSTNFDIRIDLGKNLTPRERTILFNSARGCEVSKMLSGENKFTYELLSGSPG